MPFRAKRRQQFWSVDVRDLDMHRLGGGMVYCISVLENFSRAMLASAISRKQENEAFFAVVYDAIRHFGLPEALVSDNGTIFTSHDTRWTCEHLDIEKREIKQGRPYQNSRAAAFGMQRRMADWSFESAQTREDFLAAHDKWMRDDNYQRPFAHEKRDDGCHSPAAVLQWMNGVQPEPELGEQAFSAMCETRRLNKAGYARFRNFLLYGERNLAEETVQVDSLQDGLMLDSNQERLSRHSVEWAPDDHHFPRVGYPRLYDHRSLSAQ